MSFSPTALLAKLQALPETSCYWVAYSGGLDSHVLLHAIAQISDQLNAPLRAIHVHHGLQKEADLWLLHAEDVSQRLGIELTSLRLNLQPAKGESIEAVARDARYDAMRALMSAGDVLLTAQHQNDQAETLLLQLMRGSGPSGLAAMPERAAFGEAWLVRPLLDFKRAELAAYAELQDLKWIEDGSNSDLRFDRNYIRHQLMPLLEQRWPASSSTIARSARHCAEAQQLIDHLATQDHALIRVEGVERLSVIGLRGLSPPRCKAVLRHWVTVNGFQRPSTKQLDRILDEVLVAADDGSPIVTWAGVEVRRFRDQLYIMPPLLQHNAEVALPWVSLSSLPLPMGGWLHLKEQVGGIDLDIWRQGAVDIRFRQGGERCRRQGEQVSRSLKRIFQEVLQIPPWLRDRIPLIYIDGELAAVAGFLICESFAASAGQLGIMLNWEMDVSIADQLPK
jgi:tRNA(Ile)-lysidine synthase